MTSSQLLAERLEVQLPDDFARWLDEDGPTRFSGVEFDEPLTTERMLDPQPGDLWGGFMPPDTLPVIGNRYGDWICLRLNLQGAVRDWVLWRHSGGDWTVIGKSFVEALIYESLSTPNPTDRPRVEFDEPLSSAAKWALEQLLAVGLDPKEVERFGATDNRIQRQAMLQWCDSQATRRDQAVESLDCAFRRQATPALAASLDAPWEPDFVRYTFDSEQIPESLANRVLDRLELTEESADAFQQDWIAAEQIARKVIQDSDPAGWCYDVAGWASERRGDRDQAVSAYRKSIEYSAFTDESVLIRTHWFDPRFGKFAAHRLHELGAEPADDYERTLTNGESDVHRRVADYWTELAEEAESQERWDIAYGHYWKAGWDVGFMPLERLPALFESLSETAMRAGGGGLAHLARLHGRFVWKA